MKYDFDKIIDRSGSGDLKHEVLKARYGRDDLIALWVADMDFETPLFVLDAVKNRLQHLFVNKADWRSTMAKYSIPHSILTPRLYTRRNACQEASCGLTWAPHALFFARP